jgi:hypothetical protein
MADKQKGQFIPAIRPIEPADESVAEILEDRQQHFDELRLSPSERKRLLEMRQKQAAHKRKEKARADEREKNRITTYLPTNLIATIGVIASKESVSMAQVISFFLFEAVEHYERQEISFLGHKYPSESPRYASNLIHPKDGERMEKVKSRKNEKSGWGT